MDPRAKIEALLRGLPGAPAFLPLVERLAPRLSGTSYAAMTDDPATWAAGVEQAARLVGADAVAVGCDRDIALRALRHSPDAPETEPRMAAAVEALHRLVAMHRARLGCVAGIAGPASCAAAMAPGRSEREALAAVKPGLTRLVEALAKQRPDLLLFFDDVPAEPSPDLKRLYATLKKVAAYYGMATGLYGTGEGFAALGLEVLFASRSAGAPGGMVLPLPADLAAAQTIMAEARASRAAGLGFTLAVTADDDLETIRSIGAAVGTIAG